MAVLEILVTISISLPKRLGEISYKEKLKAFNWNYITVKNGHSFLNLKTAFSKTKKLKKPTAIILNTVKGKGIKEFENDPIWHARKLQGKEIEIGKKRLEIK